MEDKAKELLDGERGQLVPGVSFVPLRLFGAGAYLAWLFTIHFTTRVLGSPGAVSDSFVLSNFVNLAVLIAVTALARRIAPISARRGLVLGAGAISSLGTLMVAISPKAGAAALASFIAGNVLTGAGTALLILLWSEIYASLPKRGASFFYSGSFILAGLLYYLTAALGEAAQLGAISILPLLSVGMLVSSLKLLPAMGDDLREASTGQWSFPWRPSILLAVYAIASTIGRSMSFGTNDQGMIGLIAIAAVVLVCSMRFFEKFDVRLLYKVTPTLIIAGLLAIMLFNEGAVVGSVLLNAGFSGFVILTLIVLSNISYEYGVTAVWLFGLTRSFRTLASILAAKGYSWLTEGGYLSDVELGAFAIVLVSASAMMLLSDKDFTSTWGLVPLPTRRPDVAQEFCSSFEGRCSIVARKHGLTLREEEVLTLLAQDKSIAAIEGTLFISNSTAKSHIRHIYAKLGVHSRDEVVKMVEGDPVNPQPSN